jgi:uncharacterized protein (TIGR02231 family)
MKIHLISLLALSLVMQLPAQTTVNSQITDVTVFLQGAQVTRTLSASLEKGGNELLLQGLANGINPQSIQVSAPADVLINSVVHEVNYQKELPKAKRVVAIADSLQILRDLVTQNSGAQSLIESERQLLAANQRLSGELTGVDVAELERSANFLRARLTDLETRKQALVKKRQEYDKRTQILTQQYQELNGSLNQPSNDIRIKLDANSPKGVDLQVRYVVANAAWQPGYDLRAKDTQSPIQFEYRADVFQQTGEDWKDVNLTLSTGNPNVGGSYPILAMWNLYAYDEYAKRRAKGYAMNDVMAKSAPAPSYDSDESAPELEEVVISANGVPAEFGDVGQTTLADYTAVEAGATTAEFVIGVKQTCISGDKPQQVNIQSTELKADYRHFAVPKLDKDAFLTAGITGWEALNLLPGNARIFFEGTYVTEAYIDPAITEDTLSLSLGRDRKVIIQRELLKDFTKARVIGFNREKTTAWEYKIKNTKSSPVHLILEDQVPISQDKDIVVKVEEISGAKQDPTTGKLVWDLTLQPGETKTLRLIFSVKHPKNKPVSGI